MYSPSSDLFQRELPFDLATMAGTTARRYAVVVMFEFVKLFTASGTIPGDESETCPVRGRHSYYLVILLFLRFIIELDLSLELLRVSASGYRIKFFVFHQFYFCCLLCLCSWYYSSEKYYSINCCFNTTSDQAFHIGLYDRLCRLAVDFRLFLLLTESFRER